MTYFFMFMQLLLNLHFRTSQILILYVRARALLLVFPKKTFKEQYGGEEEACSVSY
jgi:hypothetical protein